MAEPVGAVAGVDQQHLGRDGLAQRGKELRLGQAGHLGQQLVVDPGPGGRGHPQHPLGRLGQELDPGQQGVAQARGQLAVGGGGGQLLHEEGVAAGAGVDPLDQLGRDRRPQDPGQLGRDLGPAEPGQLQPLDPAAAVQLGQERPQRVAAVQLVAAVGEHQRAGGRGAGCGPGRPSRSRVERSAQCRSSTTSTAGRSSPRRSSSPSSSSNSRPCSDHGPGVVDSAGPALPGSARPGRRPGPARGGGGPARTGHGRGAAWPGRARRGRGRTRAGPRSGGRTAPPRRPAPRSRRPGRSPRRPRAAATTSPTRRVLPTPASPPTSTAVGVPPAARSPAAASRASSSVRPTKVGLVSVAVMSTSMAPSAPEANEPAGPPARRCLSWMTTVTGCSS